MRRLAVGGLLALIATWTSAPTLGFVPSAEKVSEAVAETNDRDQRAQALQVEVVLRDPLGHEKSAGTAWLHPAGEVRLELRTPEGDVERRRLVGGRERVMQDGRSQSPERPLLPPLALLQADTGDGLRALLRALGGRDERVELGLEGSHDCYVLGGRRRAASGKAPGGASVALWIDVESSQPVRIDRADGVRFRLGPPRTHGEIRFPAFIDVEAPGRPVWRLDVHRVAPAGAAAFRPPGSRARP
jgi:hypothetical protein